MSDIQDTWLRTPALANSDRAESARHQIKAILIALALGCVMTLIIVAGVVAGVATHSSLPPMIGFAMAVAITLYALRPHIAGVYVAPTLDIVLTKRADDWHARVSGKTGVWGCGKSPHEAVGNLISAHSETFNLTVK